MVVLKFIDSKNIDSKLNRDNYLYTARLLKII